MKPETEDMNTMLPLPEAFSNGYASWLKWNDPSKFVLITLQISSSVTSAAVFNDVVLPALFTLIQIINQNWNQNGKIHNFFFWLITRMLRLPLNRDATVSISFFLCSLFCTSHTDPLTFKPIPSHSFKHLSKSSWLRQQVWTVAPNSASSSTVARLNGENNIT